MTVVGIIGTGAVGAMLVRAHARFGQGTDFIVEAANRSPARLEALRATVPGLRIASAEDVAARAAISILCLPSRPYLEEAARLATQMPAEAVFVCISSGVHLSALAEVVPRPIVKMVPSLAHEAGRGVSLLIPGPRATQAHVDLVRAFMAPISVPLQITEADARIATNITGCGPAIMAAFAELLASSAGPFASALGERELLAMSTETLAGVAALLEQRWSLPQITKEVATVGGTTEAAVAVLRARLPEVLEAMHEATYEREAALRGLAPRAAP
jgi:pyrroline-5-carboxylate reductase